MSENDKLRYEADLVKIKEMKENWKKEKPILDKGEDGIPKRPLSAYMIFAKDVRAVLKKKMP